MYFFDFCCLFPATFRQSASFSSTNIDAYYLILACKAREHIDFNFTVDANIVRLFVAIAVLVAESFGRMLCPAFRCRQERHGAHLISQLVQALSGGTSQWKREASYSSGRALLR